MSLTALLGLAGCDRAEPETFLLPDGFSGPFYVFQGRPDGEPARVEDGRRIYAIPADGLLVSQATANTGTVDEQFFYVRPDGSRRALTERVFSTIPDTPQSRSDTTGIISGGGAGSIGADEVPYRQFAVGTRAQILDAPDLSGRLNAFTRPAPPPRQGPAE